MVRKALGDVLRGDVRWPVALQLLDDLLGSLKVRSRVKQVGQADRGMGCHQQSQFVAAAETLQPKPVPAVELLVAVDDQHGRSVPLRRMLPIEWQPALAVMQFDDKRPLPGKLECLPERGQQGRLPGAVWPDDLTPPGVSP